MNKNYMFILNSQYNRYIPLDSIRHLYCHTTLAITTSARTSLLSGTTFVSYSVRSLQYLSGVGWGPNEIKINKLKTHTSYRKLKDEFMELEPPEPLSPWAWGPPQKEAP